jgi:hypothetical protein
VLLCCCEQKALLCGFLACSGGNLQLQGVQAVAVIGLPVGSTITYAGSHGSALDAFACSVARCIRAETQHLYV